VPARQSAPPTVLGRSSCPTRYRNFIAMFDVRGRDNPPADVTQGLDVNVCLTFRREMRKAVGMTAAESPHTEAPKLPAPLPHTVPAPVPGTVARRRFWPRIDYELISCGLHGHELVGVDALEVRESDRDVVRQYDGLRWHRCLRCDAWIVLELPTQPAVEHPPDLAEIAIPVRGRRLRDRYVLRLIVLDRLLHALVLGLLAVGIFAFAAHSDHLHSAWTRVLAALQNDSGSWIVKDLNKLFTLDRTTLYLLGLAAAAYTALLLVEAVGLWTAKRWAKYLTFAELTTLLPFEIYELYGGVSPLKLLTLAINLAIMLYLLVAHRLFGIRGGARAAMEAYGDEG
jgi:uncharacterized membrane protein (DUF2068 family)